MSQSMAFKVVVREPLPWQVARSDGVQQGLLNARATSNLQQMLRQRGRAQSVPETRGLGAAVGGKVQTQTVRSYVGVGA